MKKLQSELFLSDDSIEKAIDKIVIEEESDHDKPFLRKMLIEYGLKFQRFTPRADIAEVDFLACDCSISVSELRYQCLWATHSVAVYARFDGKRHRDMLTGNGQIVYTDLMSQNKLDVGRLMPYNQVEDRKGIERMDQEITLFMDGLDKLNEQGTSPEYVLLDGSIYTNLKKIAESPVEQERKKDIMEKLDWLRANHNLVGLVEDSHSSTISRSLGLKYTDLLLFDLALDANEYVSFEKQGIQICFLKLPAKDLPPSADGFSSPLTVRWEFSRSDFLDDLERISGCWVLEDDILHSQIYPVRIADHLSRNIKANGVLDEIVVKHDLKLRHRSLRQQVL